MMAAEPAPYVVVEDRGGVMRDYVARAGELISQRRRVEIRGLCASACTIFLWSPDTCVGPGAVLVFHAAREGGAPSPIGTMSLTSFYPPQILRWVERRGGLTTRDLHLSGPELGRLLPSCDPPGPTS